VFSTGVWHKASLSLTCTEPLSPRTGLLLGEQCSSEGRSSSPERDTLITAFHTGEVWLWMRSCDCVRGSCDWPRVTAHNQTLHANTEYLFELVTRMELFASETWFNLIYD